MKTLRLFLALAAVICVAAGRSEVKLPAGEIDPVYFYDTNGTVLNEGDEVDVLGRRCIVVRSNANQPGLVISLEAVTPSTVEGYNTNNCWVVTSDRGIATGLTDHDSGLVNLFNLKRKLDMSLDYDMGHFYVFYACEQIGNGWYLPAINELALLYNALGYKVPSDEKTQNEFNKKLEDLIKANVDKKSRPETSNFASSTEFNRKKAYTFGLDKDGTYGHKDDKWLNYTKWGCRSILPAHLVKEVSSGTKN